MKYFEHYGGNVIEKTCENYRVAMPYYHEKKIRTNERFGELFNISQLNFDVKPAKRIMIEKSIITPREYECLGLLARGCTMKTAAKKLAISPRTVEQHLRNIKEKLGLRTKNQLVEAWYEIV